MSVRAFYRVYPIKSNIFNQNLFLVDSVLAGSETGDIVEMWMVPSTYNGTSNHSAKLTETHCSLSSLSVARPLDKQVEEKEEEEDNVVDSWTCPSDIGQMDRWTCPITHPLHC